MIIFSHYRIYRKEQESILPPPVKNLPAAIEKASIPVTCMLIEEGNCNCLLLNVGSQHIILCSIRVYKKTLATKEIIKGITTSFVIDENSSFIDTGPCFFTGDSSSDENNKRKKAMAEKVPSR